MSEEKRCFSETARGLSRQFSSLEQVEAVALGGSQASGPADASSDLDLYVFTRHEIPPPIRGEIAARAGASQTNLDLKYWGCGDVWIDQTGLEIDVSYFDIGWMEKRIELVVDRHQPGLGYTTCFWRTVRQSQTLFDRNGRLSDLKAKCASPFPTELRKNIIEFNRAVLKKTLPSYFNQIRLAAQRRDFVSLNHRIAALLASYFDILFAFNRILHPGEKRLLAFALKNCPALPRDFEADIKAVLKSAAFPDESLLHNIDALIENLGAMLETDPRL